MTTGNFTEILSLEVTPAGQLQLRSPFHTLMMSGSLPLSADLATIGGMYKDAF